MCVKSPLLGRHFCNEKMIGFPECLQRGGTLQKAHAPPVCRNGACAPCKALLFCQRPACLTSGAFCAHPLGEPDTGLVMEKRTPSICPKAAVGCRFVGELTVSTPPLGSFRSTFLCLLRKGLQATGLRKDKPHRALWQAAGSLCGDAILFPLQQMSAPPLSPAAPSVRRLSFLSREPSCPGCFVFHI